MKRKQRPTPPAKTSPDLIWLPALDWRIPAFRDRQIAKLASLPEGAAAQTPIIRALTLADLANTSFSELLDCSLRRLENFPADRGRVMEVHVRSMAETDRRLRELKYAISQTQYSEVEGALVRGRLEEIQARHADDGRREAILKDPRHRMLERKLEQVALNVLCAMLDWVLSGPVDYGMVEAKLNELLFLAVPALQDPLGHTADDFAAILAPLRALAADRVPGLALRNLGEADYEAYFNAMHVWLISAQLFEMTLAGEPRTAIFTPEGALNLAGAAVQVVARLERVLAGAAAPMPPTEPKAPGQG